MVFTEYEQIPHKKANGIFSTATLPENAERSRIREVVPYEENRVELIPTKENNTGYINASHIKVRGVRGIQQGVPAGCLHLCGSVLTLPTPGQAGLFSWFVTHRGWSWKLISLIGSGSYSVQEQQNYCFFFIIP